MSTSPPVAQNSFILISDQSLVDAQIWSHDQRNDNDIVATSVAQRII